MNTTKNERLRVNNKGISVQVLAEEKYTDLPDSHDRTHRAVHPCLIAIRRTLTCQITNKGNRP
jgi:hypothetical protein